MTSLRALAFAGLLLSIAGCSPSSSDVSAVPQRIRAHVEFLADDLLEGREAGSRGYDIAARYVASQFAAAGLEPAGAGGTWLQRVPLLRGERIAEGAALIIEGGGERYDFTFERDFIPAIGFDRTDVELSAPLVFVGQAIAAPEFGHDDYAGVDVRGKIAVMLDGAPARFGIDPRAFYASSREKLHQLSERGAVGVLTIGDPEREKLSPWARGAANWRRPGMRLLDAADRPVDTFPQLQARASLSADAARRLFRDAPQQADEVFRRLADGTLQAFDLPLRATLKVRTALTRVDSWNVAGRLAGSDPVRASEYVVYSAHLDHIGIGAAVDGDAVYNGAVDNALGVGILLEAARLAVAAPRPARSQVFVALTAEEKGLLGAEQFARAPTVDGELVADLNIDMPVMLGAQDDVIAIGIEHSTLQPLVEQAARELGIALTPDPFPEQSVFVRSDQYAFIRRGIPAVYLDGGVHASDPGVDGTAQLTGFIRDHYHQPSDEATLPIHYPSAARLAELNQRIGSAVANAAERPRWNDGDFFGERFGRK